MGIQSAADAAVRNCRVCGCSDIDCSACILRTGAPCLWVREDLCSACATLEQLLERSLEMVRAGASLVELGPLVAAQAQLVLGLRDDGASGAGEVAAAPEPGSGDSCIACDAEVQIGHFLHSCEPAPDDVLDQQVEHGDCTGEVDGYPDEDPHEDPHVRALVEQALKNAWDNGYDLSAVDDVALAVDLMDGCAEVQALVESGYLGGGAGVALVARLVGDIRASQPSPARLTAAGTIRRYKERVAADQNAAATAEYRETLGSSRQMCLHGNTQSGGAPCTCPPGTPISASGAACPACSGSGRVAGEWCAACDGTGRGRGPHVAPDVLFRCPACRTTNPECYRCGELAFAREVVSVRYGRDMSHRHICDACVRRKAHPTPSTPPRPQPIPQWAVDIAVALDETDNNITPDGGVRGAFGALLLDEPVASHRIAHLEQGDSPDAGAADTLLRKARQAVWDKIWDWGVVTGGGQDRGSLIAVAGVDRALTALVEAARRMGATHAPLVQLAQLVGEPGLEADLDMLVARVAERLSILDACRMPDAPELRELVREAAGLPPDIVSALRGVAASMTQEIERTYPPEEDTVRGAFRTLGRTVAQWMMRRAIDATIALYVDHPPYICQTLSFAGLWVEVEDIATWSTAWRRAALTWAMVGNFADPPEAPPAFLGEVGA